MKKPGVDGTAVRKGSASGDTSIMPARGSSQRL
jgi:hypothetical protein